MQVDQLQLQSQGLTLKMDFVQNREFSDEKRKELADKGHAMPDGSFPIETVTDLHNAIQSIGRSKNYAKTKAHIIERAKALSATSILPDDWKINKFIDDVKDVFQKAIGTSSSVDQERDERTVENYVRQSANTNVAAPQPNDYTIGGNTMSDITTEPDPKGNIAVQKDFPTASGTLVNQETRPEGDVSVSDAPNNPGIVPNQETMPSSATSAVAPSRSDEMNQPTKITKSTTCPDCGADMVHECWGDSTNVNKAASEDEVTETVEKAAPDSESKETPADEARETKDDQDAEAKAGTEKPMKKSLWGGAFAPIK